MLFSGGPVSGSKPSHVVREYSFPSEKEQACLFFNFCRVLFLDSLKNFKMCRIGGERD